MHLGKTKEVERIAAAHTVSPVISAGEGLLGGLEDRFLSLRRLLELMPDGVALVDELGVIRYVNGILIVMTGYPRDELVGESVESLLPSQRRSRHVVDRAKYFVNPRARQMGAELDLSLLRRDGTELAIDVALTTITFRGKPWIVAAVRDDSVARAAERARTASEQRFRLTFDDNMAPMVFSDAEDLAIAVNDAFCRMVGFAREELLGRDSTQFTYPEDVGITEETHHRLIAGDVDQVRYIKRYLRKDGRVIVVEVARSRGPRRVTPMERPSTSSRPSATSLKSGPSPPSSRTRRSTTRSRDSPIGRCSRTGSSRPTRGLCARAGWARC